MRTLAKRSDLTLDQTNRLMAAILVSVVADKPLTVTVLEDRGALMIEQTGEKEFLVCLMPETVH